MAGRSIIRRTFQTQSVSDGYQKIPNDECGYWSDIGKVYSLHSLSASEAKLVNTCNVPNNNIDIQQCSVENMSIKYLKYRYFIS